jgi:hypothetical protein
MARRRVGDSPGGSTTTGSRSSLSDTNDDARESSHPSVARAVERAATSLAVHPDAAYETFRASVLKSSLKLRSARARGGGTEAVGASDEASQTASSSGDEKERKRESFLAPLRARLANTAAFELQIPSPVAIDERTNGTNDKDKDASAEPRSVANAPRSEEDDARYHANDGGISRVPDSVETSSEVETTSAVAPRDVEAPDERSRQSRSRPCSPPPPRRRSFESAARARSADSQKKSGGGDRRRRRERPRVSLDAPTSAALGDDVFGATASPSPGPSGSTPSGAPRRRSASRLFVAREATRRETRASPGSVSRDIGATGGGSRGASARPRLAIRDGDLGKIETSLFDDGETTRAFFETERLRDVNVNANAASADAENREIAVSESPRVRDIVRRLSLDSETPRTPETLLARVEALEAERDALRKSVEKLTRKKRRKHSRDDRVEDRVSSDAALPRTVVANERRDTNDASVGSSAYVDETRTKTTEDGRSMIATKEDENERVGASRRGILISALTRLFGVSAFVAMAAALLLAAVDIFDIVDPAAPIGATEHSGRLTGSIDLNVDRLDRYWERDTGPTGRAARSMLKLPKEMFVRFVADAKNAVTSAWLSGHEEARETEGAFEYDDYPVPAPS